MTDLAKDLAHHGFTIFNVDPQKAPVDRNGHRMTDWESIPQEVLRDGINWENERFGMRMGLQGNGLTILSLDFDICGKSRKNPQAGESLRIGCDITKKYWDEWSAVKQNDNGIYNGGTTGNYNMLVDYTHSAGINERVNKMKTIKNAKLAHGGMEVFYGAVNQVIPPTATIDKTTKKVGNPRMFMGLPFKVIDRPSGEEDWIISLLDRIIAENTTAPRPERPAPVIVSEEEPPAEYDRTDPYHELLMDIIDNRTDRIDRDEWLEVCGCLIHNKKPKAMWMEWSLRWSQDAQHRTNSEKIWDDFKRKIRPVSIYLLEKLAKKYEYDKYRDWLIKHKKYLKMSILTKGANDVAQFLAPILKLQVKYHGKMWYTFDPNTNLWRISDEPRAKIVSFLQAKIDEAKATITYKIDRTADEAEKKKLQDMEKDYIKHRSAVASGGYADNLKKYLIDYLYEKDCYKLFDKNVGILPFKNGILDLKTKVFRHGLKQSDYLTKTVDFAYQLPTEEQKARVKMELKKVCNWNDRHLDYYGSALGYAMTGEASRKQVFFYLRGQKASNGKSSILEALSLMLPAFVGSTSNTTFNDKNTTFHKAVATWSGYKILWVNEMNGKANDEIIKSICDGTSIKYAKMYAEEMEMEIGFKLFVVSNHTLEHNGCAGMARRHKLLQMNSDFREEFIEDNFETCEFVTNDKLKEELAGELKHAVIDFIVDYSKAFYDDGDLKPYPEEWNEENKQALGDSDKFGQWFHDNFDIGSDKKCSKEDFELRLKEKGFDKIKWKDKLVGMRIQYTYDSQERQCIQGKRMKGFFTGFGVQQDTDEANGQSGPSY